ncbi:MAG: cupredoxin family copper-binding protein [Patescibacteria group bacterium]
MSKKLVGGIFAVLVLVIFAAAVVAMRKDDDTTIGNDTPAGSSSESTNITGGQHANIPSDENNTSSSPSSTAQETDQVAIEDLAFTPASVKVKKGATVTWTNKDSTPHTITGVDSNKGPESGTLEAGDTYSFTFDEVGTFGYICDFHSSMKGEVTVTE